jgi:DNA-binding NtrC family response regulator
MLRVVVTRGPDAGLEYVSSSDTISIGSAPNNDVVLSDETVSRYHLELRRSADQIHVEDHGSTNGTAAGGILIERARIAPGVSLALGKTAIAISDGDTVELELFGADRLGQIRGCTPVMLRLMASIKRAAQSDVSVLLLGETGTGKEIIARAIHEASPRKAEPFETVDCGALLPTLIASELFGHEKGAFTGADKQHIGAFERAHGGTLFLDEIGELPSALQPALLGALERRSFRRIGGQKPISVDVRFVAATHRDLRSEVNSGTFRQDLYYRIAVLLLRVPPLRSRTDDIPLLVRHFMEEAGYEGALEDLFTTAAMDALMHHPWPGNVRELRNYIEAALAMGEAQALDGEQPAPDEEGADGEVLAHARRPYVEARTNALRDFEERYLRDLMTEVKGNVSLASRVAKMNRANLIKLLKRHRLK